MAYCSCFQHRPDSPHYRTYAQPSTWLELPCSVGGCTQKVSIWLNPEEVKDYERGSRLFHDANFNAFRVDDRGLNTTRLDLLRYFQIKVRLLRKTQSAKRAPKAQKKLKS